MDTKIAIVTGANTGIGLETTIGLAKENYKVVMACRNKDKAKIAKNLILKKVPKADLDIMILDLASLASVNEFAKSFKEKYKSLNLLVNNAGLYSKSNDRTLDGFEINFGVNYLGHFLLTALLIDLMPDNSSSRIISLSSVAHKSGKIYLDDPNFENSSSEGKAYSQSKLACLMFADELNRRLQSQGKKILSVSAHPGVSGTDIFRGISKYRYFIIKYVLAPFLFHSVESAAQPILLAATGENVKGGEYYGPQGYKDFKGEPGIAKRTQYSNDPKIAKDLWEISENLTSCRFGF